MRHIFNRNKPTLNKKKRSSVPTFCPYQKRLLYEKRSGHEIYATEHEKQRIHVQKRTKQGFNSRDKIEKKRLKK